jgi:hypothetical protein
MLFFGYDMSSMTDEELIDSAIKVAGVFGRFGVTVKNATEAFSSLGKAVRDAQLREDIQPSRNNVLRHGDEESPEVCD